MSGDHRGGIAVNAGDVKKAVKAREREIVSFLSKVLQTPSVTGYEAAVAEVIAREIEGIGLRPRIEEAEKGRPNLLAEWEGLPGPRFVFNGHMDVFPPPAGSEEEYGGPWSGRVEGGWIFGSGANDMKAGLCGSIMAVRVLKEMGFVPKGSVLLTCTCDEENGGWLGVKHLLGKGLIKGDLGLNMEPTSLKLLLEHSGIFRARFTIEGKGTHASNPSEGIDALEKSIGVIQGLYELGKRLEKRSIPGWGSPTLNVTTLHAGTATNVIADRSTFSIDRRLVPGESHDEAEAEIMAVLEEQRKKDPDLRLVREIISDRPALEIPPDSAIVKAIEKGFKDLQGKPLERMKARFGSDAADIVKNTGMPMPILGPGNEDEATSVGEKLSIEEYLAAVEIYALTVARLLSTRAGSDPHGSSPRASSTT